jgi:chromosome partitioning protein
MSKVISIASQKGGTGKTSTSISLAAGLALQGERVLLIDIDSQANASKVLLPQYQEEIGKNESLYRTVIDRQSLSIHKTAIANLALVPSHILLSDTDVVLTTAIDHREARLKHELDKVRDYYDYVLIDCPPALGWLSINAFTASDEVIVVISPGYFELESTVQIGKTIREVQENFNAGLKLRGFLFTMSDPTINSRTSIKLLRQTYPDQVLDTIIPRNVDLKDASFNKQDVFTYAPKSSAALAYQKLMEEVFPA